MIVAAGWRLLILHLVSCLSGIEVCALTMPWRTIWIRPGHEHDRQLVRHEVVHVEQIKLHGAWKFSLLYAWYSLRYGYWRNPFEIEAYMISDPEWILGILESKQQTARGLTNGRNLHCRGRG